MAFFRIKKIKGNEYVYSVENEWKKKGSRQKVKGYLGKAYRFYVQNDIGFLDHFKINDINSYIENNGKNKIINDLVEWEFFKFGIEKDFLSNESFKIQKNNKNAVLLINEGYMSTLTLSNLANFKQEDEETDGYRLARAFVEAGIKVPQEVFVGLFGKITKWQNK
jgi:hypothetical protein